MPSNSTLEERILAHSALTPELHSLVARRLEASNPPGKYSINTRTKDLDSARDKMDRKGYTSIGDLKDLTGLRVITAFQEHVPVFARILKEIFREHIAVTRFPGREGSEFGYVSTHLEGTISDAVALELREPRFVGMPFEIQVRSIFENAWAEVEHGLGYKSKDAPPPGIRRRFAQLAALVEVSDGILNEISGRISEFHLQAESNPLQC